MRSPLISSSITERAFTTAAEHDLVVVDQLCVDVFVQVSRLDQLAFQSEDLCIGDAREQKVGCVIGGDAISVDLEDVVGTPLGERPRIHETDLVDVDIPIVGQLNLSLKDVDRAFRRLDDQLVGLLALPPLN